MELGNKVALLEKFRSYLLENTEVKSSKLSVETIGYKPFGAFYVRRYIKSPYGYLFLFNNGLIQVCFKDKAEIYVDMRNRAVTLVPVVSREHKYQVTVPYAEAVKLSETSEIAKRLKLTRDIMKGKCTGEKQELLAPERKATFLQPTLKLKVHR